MKTVTIYEITRREVQQVNGFAFMRSASVRGPACLLGGGDVLLGVEQLPLGHVTVRADGSYVAMSPELREMLEAPILADFKLALDHQRETMWRYFVGAPLWLRIWRALTC